MQGGLIRIAGNARMIVQDSELANPTSLLLNAGLIQVSSNILFMCSLLSCLNLLLFFPFFTRRLRVSAQQRHCVLTRMLSMKRLDLFSFPVPAWHSTLPFATTWIALVCASANSN